MYDEISIVILLGLILIFILLHFDFKNKINKFEKNFKNVENTFNKKILKMIKVLDNNFGKIVGKIDCEVNGNVIMIVIKNLIFTHQIWW